jgi:hypothetical protein
VTSPQPGTAASPNASSGRPPPGGANSSPSSTQARQGKNPANQGLADCLRLWEPATHMTKQDWARTCKRVQTRLDNVRVESIDPPGKRRGPGTRTCRE